MTWWRYCPLGDAGVDGVGLVVSWWSQRNVEGEPALLAPPTSSLPRRLLSYLPYMVHWSTII